MSTKFNEGDDLWKKAQAANLSLGQECNKLKLDAINQKELECKLR